jgi:hypothetical protein
MMTIKNLREAIIACNEGRLQFPKRLLRSFLFEGYWYPLRRTINHARELSNLPKGTTDRDFVDFAFLLPYVRMGEKAYQDNLPIQMSSDEKFEEIRLLTEIIDSLTVQK